MLVDPETGEPTRVGIRRDEDGRRIRYAKKSGTELD
jgi:large subunit ribosomal protein L24